MKITEANTDDVKKTNAENSPFSIQAIAKGSFTQFSQGNDDIRKPKPINIKIKIQNAQGNIARNGFVSTPHMGRTKGGSKKVRLSSSDQTIMSFDLLVEDDLQKPSKKSRNKFMQLLMPGRCLTSKTDDDKYPYIPSTSEVNKRKIRSSVSQDKKTNNNLNEEHTESFASKKQLETPTAFLGKCKPGGCLDPTFSEEKYCYKPPLRSGLISEQKPEIIIKSVNIDGKPEDTAQNVATGNKNNGDQNILEKSTVHPVSSANSLDTNSDFIITYPSTPSSCEIKTRKEAVNKNSKNKKSDEDKRRISQNELTEVYFRPPKTNGRQSKEKNLPVAFEEQENFNDGENSFKSMLHSSPDKDSCVVKKDTENEQNLNNNFNNQPVKDVEYLQSTNSSISVINRLEESMKDRNLKNDEQLPIIQKLTYVESLDTLSTKTLSNKTIGTEDLSYSRKHHSNNSNNPKEVSKYPIEMNTVSTYRNDDTKNKTIRDTQPSHIIENDSFKYKIIEQKSDSTPNNDQLNIMKGTKDDVKSNYGEYVNGHTNIVRTNVTPSADLVTTKTKDHNTFDSGNLKFANELNKFEKKKSPDLTVDTKPDEFKNLVNPVVFSSSQQTLKFMDITSENLDLLSAKTLLIETKENEDLGPHENYSTISYNSMDEFKDPNEMNAISSFRTEDNKNETTPDRQVSHLLNNDSFKYKKIDQECGSSPNNDQLNSMTETKDSLKSNYGEYVNDHTNIARTNISSSTDLVTTKTRDQNAFDPEKLKFANELDEFKNKKSLDLTVNPKPDEFKNVVYTVASSGSQQTLKLKDNTMENLDPLSAKTLIIETKKNEDISPSHENYSKISYDSTDKLEDPNEINTNSSFRTEDNKNKTMRDRQVSHLLDNDLFKYKIIDQKHGSTPNNDQLNSSKETKDGLKSNYGEYVNDKTNTAKPNVTSSTDSVTTNTRDQNAFDSEKLKFANELNEFKNKKSLDLTDDQNPDEFKNVVSTVASSGSQEIFKLTDLTMENLDPLSAKTLKETKKNEDLSSSNENYNKISYNSMDEFKDPNEMNANSSFRTEDNKNKCMPDRQVSHILANDSFKYKIIDQKHGSTLNNDQFNSIKETKDGLKSNYGEYVNDQTNIAKTNVTSSTDSVTTKTRDQNAFDSEKLKFANELNEFKNKKSLDLTVDQNPDEFKNVVSTVASSGSQEIFKLTDITMENLDPLSAKTLKDTKKNEDVSSSHENYSKISYNSTDEFKDPNEMNTISSFRTEDNKNKTMPDRQVSHILNNDSFKYKIIDQMYGSTLNNDQLNSIKETKDDLKSNYGEYVNGHTNIVRTNVTPSTDLVKTKSRDQQAIDSENLNFTNNKLTQKIPLDFRKDDDEVTSEFVDQKSDKLKSLINMSEESITSKKDLRDMKINNQRLTENKNLENGNEFAEKKELNDLVNDDMKEIKNQKLRESTAKFGTFQNVKKKEIFDSIEDLDALKKEDKLIASEILNETKNVEYRDSFEHVDNSDLDKKYKEQDISQPEYLNDTYDVSMNNYMDGKELFLNKYNIKKDNINSEHKVDNEEYQVNQNEGADHLPTNGTKYIATQYESVPQVEVSDEEKFVNKSEKEASKSGSSQAMLDELPTTTEPMKQRNISEDSLKKTLHSDLDLNNDMETEQTKQILKAPCKNVTKILLNFAFQTYLNDSNEMEIKTVNPFLKPPQHNQHAITTITKSARKNDELTIPIDSEIDLHIQIRKSKTKQSLKHGSSANKEDGTKSLSCKELKKKEILIDTLNSLYDNNLLPVENIIKKLRKDIYVIDNLQSTLKKDLNSKNLKHKHSYNLYKNCKCFRK